MAIEASLEAFVEEEEEEEGSQRTSGGSAMAVTYDRLLDRLGSFFDLVGDGHGGLKVDVLRVRCK
jgi:hypothetical protein